MELSEIAEKMPILSLFVFELIKNGYTGAYEDNTAINWFLGILIHIYRGFPCSPTQGIFCNSLAVSTGVSHPIYS